MIRTPFRVVAKPSPDKKPAEHRKHPRMRYAAKVHIKTPSLAQFAQDFSENLSEGGVFIRTTNPPAVGTPVEFVVVAAQGGKGLIDAKGRVAWVRAKNDPDSGEPAGMGIEFTSMTEASRTALDSILGPLARRHA